MEIDADCANPLLDVQRQMGHTTLTMANHYVSLTVKHLRVSREKVLAAVGERCVR
jgi:hypothetical protein